MAKSKVIKKPFFDIKASDSDIRHAFQNLPDAIGSGIGGVENYKKDFIRIFGYKEGTQNDLCNFNLLLKARTGNEKAKKMIDEMRAGIGIYADNKKAEQPLLAYELIKFMGKKFADLYWDISNNAYNTYLIRGGRASLKSAFTSLMIINLMILYPEFSVIACRNVYDTMKDSSMATLKWAIGKLGLLDQFIFFIKPMEIRRKKTGQKIIFKGMDDTDNIKSVVTGDIKTQFRILWIEEAQQIEVRQKISSVVASAMRGELLPSDNGELKTYTFITYNTPQHIHYWLNLWQLDIDQGKELSTRTFYSTYLDAPAKWLGTRVLQEANDIKNSNEMLYRWDYLGEPVGDGNNVFNNIVVQRFTDAELWDIIEQDRNHYGLDFGTNAPLAFVGVSYNHDKKTLIIYEEFYKIGFPYENIQTDAFFLNHKDDLIIADSEEPATINALTRAGFSIEGAKKGKGSVHAGVQFLQGLYTIIIDSIRCPNAYREFKEYSYRANKDGYIEGNYVKGYDHTIDATRYALEAFYLGSSMIYPDDTYEDI